MEMHPTDIQQSVLLSGSEVGLDVLVVLALGRGVVGSLVSHQIYDV
jgi:hypothetical protein